MSKVINKSDTLVFNPSGYTDASNMSVSNASNAYAAPSSSSYASITCSSTSTGYVYFTFSVSGIPSGATITNVSCAIRAYINSRVTGGTAQLYANTTAKGSSVSVTATSATNYTISGGSWTVSELNNVRLRLSGRRSSNNQTGYMYLYGADLSITYEYNSIAYEITSVLSTDAVDSIDPAGQEDVESGGGYELRIDAASIDNIKVEDNGNDVSDQLTRHDVDSGGTVTANPGQAFETGFSSNNAQFYVSSSTTGTSNLEYALGYSAENPNPSLPTSTSVGNYTYVKDNNNNTATGWIFYNFDFSSIPVGSIINSISVKVYGCRENSTTDSTHVAKVGLYSGSTLKGAEQELTSTSNSIHTISNVGTWTREELQQAKLKFTVAYYGGRIGGITWTVNYTAPTNNPYYWIYSLSNVSADHTIIVGDKIIEIPEEDPVYEYYPITISSINATTNPKKGTTRVVEGSNQTIEIYPTDPLVTLITDNGIDVSSQLVAHGGAIPDPTVATLSGASYGFTLNNSTGYYTSTNKGVSKSAAVCRVTFNLPVRCLVTIQYINYAEATYDFGVFGNIDTALSTNYYAAGSSGATITDSSYKFACNASSANTATSQTITYEINAGEHFIDIKYSKDDATDSNNDTLQWKILSIEALETNNYYTYTLSNIQQAHSLIFIFGDVTYYIVDSGGNGCKLYPSGQTVQMPGDDYQITIVPNDYAWDVAVTDNNVNVDSSVEKVEQEVTKDGNTYTVVNYIYKINNVQSNHTISVVCMSTSNIYAKIDDRWSRIEHVFKKISGVWVEQDLNIVNTLTAAENIIIYKTL